MLYPLHTRVAKEAGKCLEGNNHASSDIFSLWCLLPWGLQSGVSKSKEPRRGLTLSTKPVAPLLVPAVRAVGSAAAQAYFIAL